MKSFGNIMSGLLLFFSGVFFAYFSYPFISSLLDAISNTTGIFEGWATIQLVLWIGYIGILLLWILVMPLRLILSDED